MLTDQPPVCPTGTDAPAVFDYSELPPQDAEWLADKADKIRGYARLSALGALKIGNHLLEVRARLDDPERLQGGGYRCPFWRWVDAEFAWPRHSVRAFMQAAEAFAPLLTSDLADRFDASALYLLAAPDAPPAARAHALDLASAGQTVTNKTARAILHTVRRGEPPPLASLPDDRRKRLPGEHPEPATEDRAAELSEAIKRPRRWQECELDVRAWEAFAELNRAGDFALKPLKRGGRYRTTIFPTRGESAIVYTSNEHLRHHIIGAAAHVRRHLESSTPEFGPAHRKPLKSDVCVAPVATMPEAGESLQIQGDRRETA